MEECRHEWEISYDEWRINERQNCSICHDLPAQPERWWRFCRLCHRLESFTLESGKWEHKEEKQGRPI